MVIKWFLLFEFTFISPCCVLIHTNNAQDFKGKN